MQRIHVHMHSAPQVLPHMNKGVVAPESSCYGLLPAAPSLGARAQTSVQAGSTGCGPPLSRARGSGLSVTSPGGPVAAVGSGFVAVPSSAVRLTIFLTLTLVGGWVPERSLPMPAPASVGIDGRQSSSGELRTMPLTLAQLEEIQADFLADDVQIELERMSLWSKEQAEAYFESGGEVEPGRPSSARRGVDTRLKACRLRRLAWHSGRSNPQASAQAERASVQRLPPRFWAAGSWGRSSGGRPGCAAHRPWETTPEEGG